MKKLLILSLFFGNILYASIGEITALRGEADITRGDKNINVSVGTKLYEGDSIVTATKSKLQILFNDKTIISLGQKSSFKIDEYLYDKDKPIAKFSVNSGFFKSITGKIGKIAPKQFKIKTANATIGIRGTTIIGEVTSKRDIITCSQGQIIVSSAGSFVIVNAGERTIVQESKAPKASQKVNTVLLKQLDKKSNPNIVETPIKQIPSDAQQTSSNVIAQAATDTKQDTAKENKNDIDKDKATENFEPWQEDNVINSLEDIQKIIGEQKPTYEGKIVEGSTSFGAIEKDSNFIKLGFDLGTGAMNGNMKFNDEVSNYDIDIAGRIKGDGSFNFNSNDGYNGGGKGTFNGDKLQNANGSFGFKEIDIVTNEVNNIDGKFETSRK